MKTISRTVVAAAVVAVSMLMVACEPPPSGQPPTTTADPSVVCMDHATSNDASYSGHPGRNNVAYRPSSDGTCRGEPTGARVTAVVAADQASAIAACKTVFGGVEPDYGYNYHDHGYTGPTDLWLCGFDSASHWPATCMDHSSDTDVYFTGARDSIDNIKWTSTLDGSCSTVTEMTETAVFAPYREAAVERCAHLFGFEPARVFSYRWEGGYTNAPTDLWLCVQMI